MDGEFVYRSNEVSPQVKGTFLVWNFYKWGICIAINPSKSISNGAQYVQFIAKKSKCVGLAKEIGFSAPNSSSLLWPVKDATQLLCTSKKECNELDLTAGQYF
jgi:hypothetical protein